MSGIVPFSDKRQDAASTLIVALAAADETFERLNDKTKTRIRERLGLLAAIKLASNGGGKAGVQEACKLVSQRVGGSRPGRTGGVSWHRLYNDYYAVERFRAKGVAAWRALFHGDPNTEKAFIA